MIIFEKYDYNNGCSKPNLIKTLDLENLAKEFVESNEPALFDSGSQVFMVRTKVKFGRRELDVNSIIANYTNRTHSQSYLIKENDELIGYAVIRDKIDLRKWELSDIPAEIRFAFLKPGYKETKKVNKKLVKFLNKHYG